MARIKMFKCGHPKHGRNAMPRGETRGRGVCCRVCKAASNRRWYKNKPAEHFRAQKIRLRKKRIAPLVVAVGFCALVVMVVYTS